MGADITVRLKELLRELVFLPGVSGFEHEVVGYLSNLFSPLCDEVQLDPFGNLCGVRRGRQEGPSLMLLAHADEVGGIVVGVEANGLVRFNTVGVVSPRILPGRLVRVNEVLGVIGVPPAHLETEHERQQVKLPLGLFIDVGAGSEEEVRALGISEGDPVAFWGEFHELAGGSLVCSRAIDNRIGCAILVALLERLRGLDLPGTVYFGVSVQEEIGMRGARMLAERFRPQHAIVVDTVPTDDPCPHGGLRLSNVRLGSGPVVQVAEGVPGAYVGTVAHRGLVRRITAVANRLGISIQKSALYGLYTTDAAAVHVSAGGIPTAMLSVPRRYAHSPVEVVDLGDAVAALRILESIVLGWDSVVYA
jgi:endoglucanase